MGEGGGGSPNRTSVIVNTVKNKKMTLTQKEIRKQVKPNESKSNSKCEKSKMKIQTEKKKKKKTKKTTKTIWQATTQQKKNSQTPPPPFSG